MGRRTRKKRAYSQRLREIQSRPAVAAQQDPQPHHRPVRHRRPKPDYSPEEPTKVVPPIGRRPKGDYELLPARLAITGLEEPVKERPGNIKIAGFLKVRNEILREGNLYRVLDQLDQLCDSGVVCDDASTDGTADYLRAWVALRPKWQLIEIDPSKQDWHSELRVKQRMIEAIHDQESKPDWILWLDGDELIDQEGANSFREWLSEHEEEADMWGGSEVIWGFRYTQLWREAGWARTDAGFDAAVFWKLWRYEPKLSFAIDDALHRAQFPKQFSGYLPSPRAKIAPFHIIHLGNYGKNLVWKAVQYCNSGALEQASLRRHLYFKTATYRKVEPVSLPQDLAEQAKAEEQSPSVFSSEEIKIIERMETLQGREGLCVVVIPTFNRGYALRRTVESVLSQTYQNWVCLVLDDGSTDETPNLMFELQRKDPRIFYGRYSENRGGVAMNELGMALACEMGEYWVRLGSDDYFEPHKLELDVVAMRKGAAICFGPYVDLHESRLGNDFRNLPSPARSALLSGGFAASWANIAVRTTILRKIRERHGNFCDPEIRNMEDWLVNTRLAYFSDFTWRGLLRSGHLLIGTTACPHKMPELLPDAVWRIGRDGASAKGDQCEIDARLTKKWLDELKDSFKPVDCESSEPVQIPYEIGTTTQ